MPISLCIQRYIYFSSICSHENLQVILQEKLTVTWKVHAVCAHLITFLERHKQGMANVAEQVGEAAHYDMVPTLQRHKVAEDHPEFGQRQVQAVVKYASNRVFNMSGISKVKKVFRRKN